MMIDPVALVIEVLTKAGHTEVHEEYNPRALSSPEFITVQELTGSSAHLRYSDQPQVQVVVYSNEGVSQCRQIQYKIASDLADAHSKVFDSGGIHHVRLLVRPLRQDIPNQPYGVARVVCQYEIGLSALEKWS